MRVPWQLAAVAAAMLAGAAQAQTLGAYQYVARTVAPATRTGAVVAGGLSWQCSGSECRISGPWPQPGVGACVQLAAQVGRIASYGRSGAVLSAEQLAQCNANLPPASVQVSPNVARQVQQPRITTPLQLPAPGTASAPSTSTPAPAPAATAQVALEPGGRPEDLIVHVLPPSGIRFFGVTPPGAAPALPPPSARIVGGRIESPGVRLQASAPGATATPRSSATSEAPTYARGLRSDVVLRVPVSLRDMPGDTFGIVLTCQLYASRFVPFTPGRARDGTAIEVPLPPHEALYTRGGRAGDHQVAFGGGQAFIRSIGRYEQVFDIPLQARPLFRIEDARSYQCNVDIRVVRSTGGGVDVRLLSALAAPSGPGSRADFRPAAGTTPLLNVEGNIQ